MNDFSCFDHLFDPVLILNEDKKLIYFNHQASIFFKLSPRLMKQKETLTDLCFSQDLNLEEWIGKAAAGEVLTSSEVSLQSSNNEFDYHVILKAIPLGRNFGIVIQDMTVEKNLHQKYRDQLEELKRTHAQILQADKLTTLGELTANISHEINNPLTIAAGHSEILKDILGMKDPMAKLTKLKDANQTVIDSVERVNRIIRNMKEFLHYSEDTKEYCDLEKIIESAIEWVGPAAKKTNIQIVKDVKEKTVALANRTKIEQVVINLIKNSIDALQDACIEDGIIRVQVSKAEKDRQSFIDVIDNGPGLADKMKGNLFKPFQTTKEAGKGTGLGLSICAKIVETHRGKLEHIPSSQGCHFRLKLPLIEAYSYTQNDQSLRGSKALQRVLVLDNEVQILNVMNSFLMQEGFVFIGSSDPQDALNFLQKADVDLIISDFSMPLMNGQEFVKQARQKGYQGPVLYMTSSKFIDQYNKDKSSLGIDGLIVKPFNREDVMKTIRMALRAREGVA